MPQIIFDTWDGPIEVDVDYPDLPLELLAGLAESGQ